MRRLDRIIAFDDPRNIRKLKQKVKRVFLYMARSGWLVGPTGCA